MVSVLPNGVVSGCSRSRWTYSNAFDDVPSVMVANEGQPSRFEVDLFGHSFLDLVDLSAGVEGAQSNARKGCDEMRAKEMLTCHRSAGPTAKKLGWTPPPALGLCTRPNSFCCEVPRLCGPPEVTTPCADFIFALPLFGLSSILWLLSHHTQ